MHLVVSVYDKKADLYQGLFLARTIGVAGRMFADSVATSGNSIHDHPEDFVLCQVAVFNEETGELLGQARALPLMEALEVANAAGV